MKQRTKAQMAEYQRLRRNKLKNNAHDAPGLNNNVTPDVTCPPNVTPCNNVTPKVVTPVNVTPNIVTPTVTPVVLDPCYVRPDTARPAKPWHGPLTKQQQVSEHGYNS